jgi:hypothetical protein
MEALKASLGNRAPRAEKEAERKPAKRTPRAAEAKPAARPKAVARRG